MLACQVLLDLGIVAHGKPVDLSADPEGDDDAGKHEHELPERGLETGLHFLPTAETPVPPHHSGQDEARDQDVYQHV